MHLSLFGKKNSDAEDFEGLLQAQLRGLYGVALRYVRDPAMAEDLVHDTVVRALRFKHRFEPGTNFKAWIYTILTNTFIHRYRRQKREREILEGITRDEVENHLTNEISASHAQDPENSYLRHMLSDDVLKALDEMPEDFRTVVTLCDIEGLSYKEISDALDCPVGTVMSRLFRGRRFLEKKLAHVATERGILKQPAAAVQEERADVLDINAFRRRKTG